MILPLPLIALLLGLVEGITEFLPISSTGHLILAERAAAASTGTRAEVFAIFIQLGAVLAVVRRVPRERSSASRARLPRDAGGARVRDRASPSRSCPRPSLGLLTHHWISEHLFGPRTVAAALDRGSGRDLRGRAMEAGRRRSIAPRASGRSAPR